MKTRITEILGIEYPILQGGMAWVAEHNLAAAVSEAAAAFHISMYFDGLPAPVVTTLTPSSTTTCAIASASGFMSEILGIEYPILQGGMAWVAEHNLAAAVSEAGFCFNTLRPHSGLPSIYFDAQMF